MLPKKLLTALLATACLSLAISPAFADDITFSGNGNLQIGVEGTPSSRDVTNGNPATFADGNSIILAPNGQVDIYTNNAVIANILNEEVQAQNIDFTDTSIPLPTASGILGVHAPITVNGRIANLEQVTIYDGAKLTIKPDNTIEGLVAAVNTSFALENTSELVIDSTNAKGVIKLYSSSPLLDRNGAARITFNAVQDINYTGSITGAAGKFNAITTSGTGKVIISNGDTGRELAIDTAEFKASSTKISNDTIELNNITLGTDSTLNLEEGGSTQASITKLKIVDNGSEIASFIGPASNIVITDLDLSDDVSLAISGDVTVSNFTNSMNADAHLVLSKDSKINLPGDVTNLTLDSATTHFTANANIGELTVDNSGTLSRLTGDGTISITKAEIKDSTLEATVNKIGSLTVDNATVGIAQDSEIDNLIVNNNSSIFSANSLTINDLDMASGAYILTIAGRNSRGEVMVNGMTEQMHEKATILALGGSTVKLPGNITNLGLAGATAHFTGNTTINDLAVDIDDSTGSPTSHLTGDGTISVAEVDIKNSVLETTADSINTLLLTGNTASLHATGNNIAINLLTVNIGTYASAQGDGTFNVTGAIVDEGATLNTKGSFTDLDLVRGTINFTGTGNTVTDLDVNGASTLSADDLTITNLNIPDTDQLTIQGNVIVDTSINPEAKLWIAGGSLTLPDSVSKITSDNATIEFSAGGKTINDLTINSGTSNTLITPNNVTVSQLTLPASTQLNVQGDVEIGDTSNVNADATIAISGGGTLSLPASTLSLILSGSKADFAGNSTVKNLTVNVDTNSGATSYLIGAGPITINELSIGPGAFLDRSQVSGGVNITAASLGTGQNMSFASVVPNLTLAGATAIFPSGSTINELTVSAGTGDSDISTITTQNTGISDPVSALDVKVNPGTTLNFPGDITKLTLTSGETKFTRSSKVDELIVEKDVDSTRSQITTDDVRTTVTIADAKVLSGGSVDLPVGVTDTLTLAGGIVNFTGSGTITIPELQVKTDPVQSQITTDGASTTVSITKADVEAGADLKLTGNITDTLTLTGAKTTFSGTIGTVNVQPGASTLTSSNGTIDTITVNAGATLKVVNPDNTPSSTIAIDALELTGATFTSSGNTTGIIVENITVNAHANNSTLEGSYSKPSNDEGTWLVKRGATLKVDGLTSAKSFAFEQGSTTGSLIVDGNANFSTAGEFGIAGNGSAEIVITNTANSADRQLTIGSYPIHTNQIRPEADGQHNVVISDAPTTFTQLGTTDHQFKLINIAAPISVDAALMNAKALTVSDHLTIATGTLATPTTLNEGAMLTINADATLDTEVKAINDGAGTLELVGSGPSATAMVLPAMGESTKKLGALDLTNTHVTAGDNSMYVKDLVMYGSQLDLNTSAISIDRLDLTGGNTITTTVSDENYGSINIASGSTIAQDATLNFVIQSSKHIPDNTELTVLSGNLKDLSISENNAPTAGQVTFSEDLLFSYISQDPSEPGKLLIKTDQAKQQALIAIVQAEYPQAASTTETLISSIDTHSGLADVATQLQKAVTELTSGGTTGGTAIVDIASSFTDHDEHSASRDYDIGNAQNDPASTVMPNPEPVAASGDKDNEAHFWTKILAGGATQLTDDSLSSYKQSMRGIMVGVDRDFSDRLNMGLALNLSSSNLAYTGKKLGDSLDTNSISLYGFSTYRFNDKMFMNSTLSYTRSKLGTKHIRVLSSTQEALASAKHRSQTYGGTLKLGYKAQFSPIYTLTPTVGLMHNYTKDDAYTETGASNWNFVVDSKSRSKTTLLAGVSLAADHGTWKPEVHLNVYQTLKERRDEATFGFEWMPTGQRFSNDGPKLPSTQINAGFNLGINPADEIYTEIIGELIFAKDNIAYQGALSVKVSF